MRLDGLWTVAGVEVRQRLRSGRWQVLLAVWFAVLFVVTLGLRQLQRSGDDFDVATRTGAVMFGGLSLFLLVVALLVVPALSSQSVNGDRERGVLAVLQVTDLTPWEIALGKFAAAWSVSLVFLVVSFPLDVWALLEGGVGFLRLVVVTLIQAVLLGVVAAISLALSALLARTTTSAVLSYLSVLALTLGTLLAFGLATTLVQQQVTENAGQAEFSYTDTVTHTERIWWLLAPNPVVIMVDASPKPPVDHFGGHVFSYGGLTSGSGVTVQLVPGTGPDIAEGTVSDDADSSDLLRSIRRSVRNLRLPPDQRDDYDAFGDPREGGAVWPWGLAFDVLLAAGALVVTARRLRTPAWTLPRGVRVA